jgi:hypothetical protein
LLREAEDACARRLALQHRNRSGTYGSKYRGRAEDRVREDARLAHAPLRAPAESDFPAATDLLPEERSLHEAAARAYIALFGDAAAVAHEHDEWETPRGDLGFRLVGRLDLVVADERGDVEVRRLRFGRASAPDEPELRFTAARLGRSDVRVVTADLVNVDRFEDTASIDPFENDRWMRERLALATARGERPTVGFECAYCEYIADCEAHRER